jgi:hypothetical protein
VHQAEAGGETLVIDFLETVVAGNAAHEVSSP